MRPYANGKLNSAINLNKTAMTSGAGSLANQNQLTENNLQVIHRIVLERPAMARRV